MPIAFVVSLLLVVAACAPSLPRERPVPPPTVTAAPDWTALFAAPRDVQVVPLLTGEIEVARSLLLDVAHPALDDHADRQMWVPVLAYLVRHRTAGDVLLDTGFDASFAASGHGNVGGVARFVRFARQPPGHDTAALVTQAGGDPRALRMIVLSHLHLDHTAGLPGLPSTVPLYAGPAATAHYEHMWYAPSDHFHDFPEIRTLDFSGLPGADPGAAVDLLGDGSLFVVATPGHASGNVSFVVNGTGGPILLTCDASHTREGFARGVGPGKVVDRAAADASLARLRRFAAAHPTVRVKAGHDAADWDLTRGIQDPL